eukprot:8711807-Pyramimonas_sp.AAC.2
MSVPHVCYTCVTLRDAGAACVLHLRHALQPSTGVACCDPPLAAHFVTVALRGLDPRAVTLVVRYTCVTLCVAGALHLCHSSRTCGFLRAGATPLHHPLDFASGAQLRHEYVRVDVLFRLALLVHHSRREGPIAKRDHLRKGAREEGVPAVRAAPRDHASGC